QIALATGDDVLNYGKGYAVMHRTFDVVIFQCIARINVEYGIDIETLAEFMLFIEDAVMREEGAVHDADCVHGFVSCSQSALLCRIASATASASLLKATL